MAPPMQVVFRAGDAGEWSIDRLDAVIGAGLAAGRRLDVVAGASADAPMPPGAAWTLRGVTSNERYVERPERASLVAVQQPLGRPEATRAALIPVRKSERWWELTQDERRAVIEDRSHHIAVGLEYLPAVARRLQHCRDLGGEEFDFLTWFEFAPDSADAFEELVVRLRATEEWTYVDREVDIRVSR